LEIKCWPPIFRCLICEDKIRFWKLNLASKWKRCLLVLKGGCLSEHIWYKICNGFWELKCDFLYHGYSQHIKEHVLYFIHEDRIMFLKLNLASKWKGWFLVLKGGWLSKHVWHKICSWFWELKLGFLYLDCSQHIREHVSLIFVPPRESIGIKIKP